VPDKLLQITKLEGAARQVEAAIEALRRGDFDVAITLAGAAEGMLDREGTHLFQYLRNAAQVRNIDQKSWIASLNQARDWLKHPTNELPDSLRIDPHEAAFMIARAMSKLERWSTNMEEFKIWFLAAIEK
jgi:hypothetical protein